MAGESIHLPRHRAGFMAFAGPALIATAPTCARSLCSGWAQPQMPERAGD
jgi:hypothetical protein